MTETTTQLRLLVDDEHADQEELADLTARLREELLSLDVDTVERPRTGAAPPGTKAGELVAAGALLASFARPELLAGIVAAVRSWLGGNGQRTVKLVMEGDTLELSGVSSREQRRLTDEWLRRHAVASPGDGR
jgi:predicted deacylase